jgi:hypothetical protein
MARDNNNATHAPPIVTHICFGLGHVTLTL